MVLCNFHSYICSLRFSQYTRHKVAHHYSINTGYNLHSINTGYNLHSINTGYNLHSINTGYNLHSINTGYNLHSINTGYNLHSINTGYNLHSPVSSYSVLWVSVTSLHYTEVSVCLRAVSECRWPLSSGCCVWALVERDCSYANGIHVG